MSVRDLNHTLSWTIPETDATTIAGLVIKRLERIPNQGEYLIGRDLKIIVQKKSDNRIKTTRIVVQKKQGWDSD